MSLALYRKYRPKFFSDIIGQDFLVDIFTQATKRDVFSHAYLLYGPRGTGKTTTARLIAKAINCVDRSYAQKKGEPCGSCHSCISLDAGKSLDIIEIDAASHRGIDEIRHLKESIRITPSSSRFKVFIIDEAHMLTKEAFNALLKVLEEPPAHAMLILATTEFEKIPTTISSRTQRFYLRSFSLSDIIKKLSYIVAEEKITIDSDALELVAASSEGSLRDAESLLDQVVVAHQKVTLEHVESVVGRVGFRRVGDLIDSIYSSDLPAVLHQLSHVAQTGSNVVDLARECIQYFRHLLTLKLDPHSEKMYQNELTQQEIQHMKKHLTKIDVTRLVTLIRGLIKAYSDMRYSPFPHISLELVFIEYLTSK